MRLTFSLILWVALVALAADAQETTIHDPEEYLSRSLPVLYITTTDSMPVVSKDEYLTGTYYLDAEGFDQYESVGSAENQLPLQIKGRGNASWRFPKKPYRLKLDSKAALLGMPKSKHWVLMAAYYEWLAHGRDYLNFIIAKKIGMPWTTGSVPCEVVLNGDYIGMYFLTEKIRIEKTRVNITEQQDEETDSVAITGGWLLEIDNYVEPNQIVIKDKDGSNLRITYHSPEVLSTQQRDYLVTLMNNVNDAINIDNKFGQDSRRWEEYIDLDAMVRFYVMNEVVDNQEAFSGSCWFYKDRGEDSKLIFGPVWDFGSSMGNRNYDARNFMYENTVSYVHNHWIQELVKFPRFQFALRKYWKIYRDSVYPTMAGEVSAYGQLVRKAMAADYKRWGDKSATEMNYYLTKYKNLLRNKMNFLASRWNYLPGDINGDEQVDIQDVNAIINLMLGKEGNYPGCADMVHDEVVDVSDVNYLVSLILKYDFEPIE